MLPKVCSALLPALLPALITFRRLEPNGHTGPQVTAVGCLAASDHCCGQGIPVIGIWHQHGPSVLPVWSRLVSAKPVKVVGVKSSLDVLAEVAGDPKSSSSAMF